MPRRSRPTSSPSPCSSRTRTAFRNYLGEGHDVPAEHLLIERAFRLTLSAPEMTVLIGGLRVLKVNAGQSDHGVFTKRPGTLTNDFFVNLLDMGTEWKPTSGAAESFAGCCRTKGDARWTASRVDLVLRIELRASRARGGLRVRRRKGEVRARLRRRVGQGHESRSIRSRLIPTCRTSTGCNHRRDSRAEVFEFGTPRPGPRQMRPEGTRITPDLRQKLAS